MSASKEYIRLLRTLIDQNPGPAPRGLKTKEAIGFTTRIDMTDPVIKIPERKLNYKFMAQEAKWILEGRSDVKTITEHCKVIGGFSDDGITMSGAYGPQFIQQYRYVVDTLKKDHESRQAVMTFWRQNPRYSLDIPCTVSMQFLFRGDRVLHTNVFMRSSDAWLGWPYDVFSFTMITTYIGILTRGLSQVELGTLKIFAGSAHLYEKDWEKARSLLRADINDENQSMCLYGLIYPDHLLSNLGYVLDDSNCQNQPTPYFQWLKNLAK
jgi:thymidylate synthase